MPETVHRVEPLVQPPDVTIAVPGSKSHTNRALICAALAPGRSELSGVLFADDSEAMLGALTELGVSIDADPASESVVVDGGLAVSGLGNGGLGDGQGAPIAVDVRKSGTSGRFLLPVLAATPGRFVLDGHQQLRARPFGPQLEALSILGAEIAGDQLPLTIAGRQLAGTQVSVASSISSQYLSGLLLAAPLLTDRTTIAVDSQMVSRPYVDLTLSTMESFGVSVSVSVDEASSRFIVEHQDYKPVSLALEPDASAASYFFAAAAISGGRVRVSGLGANTGQGDLGFVKVLERMGARVTHGPNWTEVAGTGTLRGVTVDMADISDTAQTLAVVACFADSPTVMTNIGFIRFKETDRIGNVVAELERRGIDAAETEDGMMITPGIPTPGLFGTYDDHRMAMSFALFGLVHPGIVIDNPACVDKTFPRYFEVLDQLRSVG